MKNHSILILSLLTLFSQGAYAVSQYDADMGYAIAHAAPESAWNPAPDHILPAAAERELRLRSGVLPPLSEPVCGQPLPGVALTLLVGLAVFVNRMRRHEMYAYAAEMIRPRRRAVHRRSSYCGPGSFGRSPFLYCRQKMELRL